MQQQFRHLSLSILIGFSFAAHSSITSAYQHTLGQGYSSQTQEAAEQCLMVDTQDVGPLSFKQDKQLTSYGYTNFLNEYGFSADSVNKSLFANTELTDVANFLRETDYSKTLVLHIAGTQPRFSVYKMPVHGSVLSNIGDSLKENPEQFVRICGDKYISQIKHGADVLIMARINFDNKEDKQSFPRTLTLRGLAQEEQLFKDAREKLSARLYQH